MSFKGKEEMYHCAPREECNERFRNCKDKKVRCLEAGSVDTCLISYKPRLLHVNPDFRDCDDNCFRCLDDALKHVRLNHGGYVVKLSKGIHHLRVNVENTVDRLTIIGDPSPVKGVPFINGQRFSPSIIDTVPEYDYRIGKGPYRVTANGRKIKVSGECDPDFTSVCEGDRVGFLFSDREEGRGQIIDFRVKCAKGNTITLDDNFGLNRALFVGEGFFIYPNVVIDANCPRKIYVTENLEFRGVVLDSSPSLVVFGGITTKLKNCVISGYLRLQGKIFTSIPNVTTGLVIWMGPSSGMMAFQGVLGAKASMVFSGNDGAYVPGCVFSLCRIAGAVINGGKAHFDTCDFFLNEIGIRASAGAAVHIPGSHFIENIIAINAFYNSTISSETGGEVGLADASENPVFIDNRLTMGAEWGSFFYVANIFLKKAAEDPYIRIDGRVRNSPEENPPDSLGNAGSFVADKPNPFSGI